MLAGLLDRRVRDTINSDLTTSICGWAHQRQRESESYGSGLDGFDLEGRTYHLDSHLFSVEVRTSTISRVQAHSAEEVLTFTYSLADGARIQLSDLFYPYDFTPRGAIAAVLPPGQSYVAYEEDLRLDAFLVDDRGIEFTFPPCLLDACAAGYVSVFVPYTDLAGLVDPTGAAAPYL